MGRAGAAATGAVRIVAKARQLPKWTVDKAFPYSAQRPPASPVSCDNATVCGPQQDIVLVPFGATRLRVGLLPWVSIGG